jgi:hypothetical protein
MSPPRASTGTRPRRSQGGEPHESRRPREGSAAPSDARDPEAQAGRDVAPRNAREGRTGESKAGSGSDGSALEGKAHGGIDTSRPSGRGGSYGLASGNEALKTAARARSPGGRAIPRGERQEGRDLRERVRPARGKGLGGRSRWTLRRRKASGGTEVAPRGGYPNPGRGTPRGREVSRYSGSSAPACVVRAKKPREGSIVRRSAFGPTGRCGCAAMDL